MGQSESVTHLPVPKQMNEYSLAYANLHSYLNAERNIKYYISTLKKRLNRVSDIGKKELQNIINNLKDDYYKLKKLLAERICKHFKCSSKSPIPLTKEYYRLESISLYNAIRTINTYLNTLSRIKKTGDIVIIPDYIQKFLLGESQLEYKKLKNKLEFIIKSYREKIKIISKLIDKDYNTGLAEIFLKAKRNPYYKECQFLQGIEEDKEAINAIVDGAKAQFQKVLYIHGGQQETTYQIIYIVIIILLVMVIFYFAWCFISKNSVTIQPIME